MAFAARGGEESNKGPHGPRTANGLLVSRPISRTANGHTVSRPHSHWVLAPGAIQEPVSNLLARGHRLDDKGKQPAGYTPRVMEQGIRCRVSNSRTANGHSVSRPHIALPPLWSGCTKNKTGLRWHEIFLTKSANGIEIAFFTIC